jgi:uncharacterized protein YqeY
MVCARSNEPMTTDLKQTIQHDLTTAMKARDTLTVATLRMALTAITNAEVAGDASVTLDDAAVLNVLATEVKRRSESAEIYAGAGRQELADKELAERAVLERYLPAEMGDDELHAIVADEVAAAAARGATGPKAMGAVIAAVRERTAGTASGSRIAAAVKSALTPGG